MNYLAHAFLTTPDQDGVLVGNLIGDLVTNRDISLYPKDIKRGITLHRTIDSYSDNHPRIRKMTKMIRPYFGKYAPVVNDIYSDYLLSHFWEQVTEERFEDFCIRIYDMLQNRLLDLHGRAADIIPRMIKDDWLAKYSDKDRLDSIFRRLATRSKFIDQFDMAIPVLEEHQDYLAAQLLLFIREANVYFRDAGD